MTEQIDLMPAPAPVPVIQTDLLEALRAADAALEACSKYVGECCTNQGGAWDKVKAALAKAEGRSA
jgi:hypothetical protein